MAFAPGVRDQRADIVSQGMGQIADLTYRGLASQGAGLAEGISQAGNGLAEGLEMAGKQFEKNRAQRGANDGLAAAMQQFGYGNPEFWDEFAKTKDEDKRSGMLTAGMGFLQDMQRNEQRLAYLDAQTKAAMNIADYKQTIAPKMAMPSDEEIKRMAGAGYIFDSSTGRFVSDRSKFQASNPMAALLGGGSADPQGAAAGGQAPAAAAAAPTAPAAQTAAPAVGQIATNKATGERIRWDGSSWVPVK